MANIISLQFSDQVEAVTGKLDYTGDDTDDADIGYWIGTDGYASAYSDIRVAGEVGAASQLTTCFNRGLAVDATSSIASTAAWSFANYVLLPTSITLAIRGDSAGNRDFLLEAENESGVYESIGQFSAVNLPTGYNRINFPVKANFWSKSFRFNKTLGGNLRIDEIYMYGAFRREDNSSLGLFSANSTVESVKDSVLDVASINGPLDYQGKLDSKSNIILTGNRVTLTGDITIGNKGNHLIQSLDPNGANRNVVLPQFPRLDHYQKIINVDGANALNIREVVGGPIIQELSNSSTVLSVECIWDQEDSTWHITA